MKKGFRLIKMEKSMLLNDHISYAVKRSRLESSSVCEYKCVVVGSRVVLYGGLSSRGLGV